MQIAELHICPKVLTLRRETKPQNRRNWWTRVANGCGGLATELEMWGFKLILFVGKAAPTTLYCHPACSGHG